MKMSTQTNISQIDIMEEAKIMNVMNTYETKKVKTHKREFSISIPREPHSHFIENVEVGCKRKRA